MRCLPSLLLLAACSGSTTREVGEFEVRAYADGTLDITHALYGPVLEEVALLAGEGSADVAMSFGSFLFTNEQRALSSATGRKFRGRNGFLLLELRGEDGDFGTLLLSSPDRGQLDLLFTTESGNRKGFSAACDADDHFMGLGGHAMDVDHVGQAFPLWVSEPGIGKEETEEPPENWFSRGTRHAASYPVPWLLRPHRGQGVLLDTGTRIDLDLCARRADRFEAIAWEGDSLPLTVIAEATPLAAVQSLTARTGRPPLPPTWAFGPWNDAVRGSDRVREVAARLRDFGAPSSVIWSEDWKGASETAVGYHLEGEWFADETLYPGIRDLASELEADGFKWFAYFSPFIREGTVSWDEAVEAGVTLKTSEGEPYTFAGAQFTDETMVDLSTREGREWAQARMEAALDLGFDGWMADYAEWLPTDARLISGDDALDVHNLYPEWWQETNVELLARHDMTFFTRSGWTRSSGLSPIVWAGDQRTSFDPDDGFPTVLAMGAGMGASGVGLFTHDVGGYQSVGNPPSTKELWFRWAGLGAFTPILRTHHGAFDTDNWQFDSDDETTEYWAEMPREHARLFPYRYGLAVRAADEGIPAVMPVSFRYGEDWGRKDAWLLGDALLVAPVLEAGATTRDVVLPGGVQWYDYWTQAPVESGTFDAPVDHIPVFAAAGTTLVQLAEAPDTFFDVDASTGLTDLGDADGARVLTLYGGGGDFVEGDGTAYRVSGSPTGSGEVTETLSSGTLEVAGVSLTIAGEVPRSYRVVVVP
jgi:alpha-glucosidase